MKDTELALKKELSSVFSGQGQRLMMMSKLILSILKLGTVSYNKLSLCLNGSVKPSSNFKRIQRFMKEYRFCFRPYVDLVWRLFAEEQEWVILTMDRTNWKFGKKDINIFLIGISYRGTAIPLMWKMLDKRGNSNQSERIELVGQLMSLLGAERQGKIRCVVADREFIGNMWITYLKELPFAFFIRIKKDAKVRKLGSHKEQQAGKLFECSSFRALRRPRVVSGHRLYIGGQFTGKGTEQFIIVSNIPVSKARQYYGERWGIEVFFGACKKRGFNFEDTHVTDMARIANIVFLLAIAFCWALKTGEYLVGNGYKITIKKIGNRKTKLFSIFRIGLDRIRETLLNFLDAFYLIQVLSCT